MNKWLWTKIVVTVFLFFLVFKNLGNQTNGLSFTETIARISLWWIFASAVLNFASQLLQNWQWKILLEKQDIFIPFKECLKIFFVGQFFNNFGLGNVSGDVKKIYDINKYSKDLKGSFIATFFDRLFGLFVLNSYAMFVGVLYFYDDPGIRVILYISVMIFVAILLFFCCLLSARVGDVFSYLLSMLPIAVVKEKFDSIRSRFYKYRKSRIWTKILIISAFIQLFRIMANYCIALAISVVVPFSYFMFFVPIIGIAVAIPISIGGYGIREYLGQQLFGSVGVTELDALIMQLLAPVIMFGLSLFGAYYFLADKSAGKKVVLEKS